MVARGRPGRKRFDSRAPQTGPGYCLQCACCVAVVLFLLVWLLRCGCVDMFFLCGRGGRGVVVVVVDWLSWWSCVVVVLCPSWWSSAHSCVLVVVVVVVCRGAVAVVKCRSWWL